jgi:hypothetical protein
MSSVTHVPCSAGPNPIHPDRMSSSERMAELASLLRSGFCGSDCVNGQAKHPSWTQRVRFTVLPKRACVGPIATGAFDDNPLIHNSQSNDVRD